MSHFVGMLSILLHVDFNCVYFRSIMGYVEMVIFFVVKFSYKSNVGRIDST